MKVKELIKKLKQYPENFNVIIEDIEEWDAHWNIKVFAGICDKKDGYVYTEKDSEDGEKANVVVITPIEKRS